MLGTVPRNTLGGSIKRGVFVLVRLLRCASHRSMNGLEEEHGV